MVADFFEGGLVCSLKIILRQIKIIQIVSSTPQILLECGPVFLPVHVKLSWKVWGYYIGVSHQSNTLDDVHVILYTLRIPVNKWLTLFRGVLGCLTPQKLSPTSHAVHLH